MSRVSSLLGTLRDQVIYPHTIDDMESAGITDHVLRPFRVSQLHLLIFLSTI